MAEHVDIELAKTQLSRLVARVEAGEEIVLARAGKPVARIMPLGDGKARAPGRLVGQGWIGADFDDPLPDDIQAALESRGPEAD